MKTTIFSIFLVLVSPFAVSDIDALSCAPVELGDAFDQSEHVFHGKVTEKNYLTWDQQMPVVTFGIIESFKGNAEGRISVTVYEQWSYDFEVGLEYVVFVQRNELDLEISPCIPIFQAFSSSIQIMREASEQGNEMRYQTSNVFYESLSDQEKAKYEENNDFLKEKRVERWDSELLQRQIIIIVSISLGLIAVFVGLIIFKKRKS